MTTLRKPPKQLTPEQIRAKKRMEQIRRKKPKPIVSDQLTPVAPGKGKLDDEVMTDYVNDGLTNKDIVEALRIEHGIVVSRQAVSKWRVDRGLRSREKNPESENLTPWRIAEEHRGDTLLRALRIEARLRAGQDVSEEDLGRHRAVATDMHRLGGAVIHYDRQGGFRLVPRRPGLDKDWIHDPRIRNDGTYEPDPDNWQ